jgi:hypothetical protein
MKKPNVVIRMGAAHWDAQVRGSDDTMAHFDFRAMDKKQRSAFHRELMNAFRSTRS